NAWKLHNYQLEHELQQLQRTLEDYRQKILELNKQRKAEQVALENKWSELICQTLQLEVACASLETEIQQLKQYEQQLINDTAK
ncbi:hypothetical protein C2G38_2025260, partial [Gigaspora rosea]